MLWIIRCYGNWSSGSGAESGRFFAQLALRQSLRNLGTYLVIRLGFVPITCRFLPFPANNIEHIRDVYSFPRGEHDDCSTRRRRDGGGADVPETVHVVQKLRGRGAAPSVLTTTHSGRCFRSASTMICAMRRRGRCICWDRPEPRCVVRSFQAPSTRNYDVPGKSYRRTCFS